MWNTIYPQQLVMLKNDKLGFSSSWSADFKALKGLKGQVLIILGTKTLTSYTSILIVFIFKSCSKNAEE